MSTMKKRIRRYYKDIGQVYCPLFSGMVKFNSRGFRHLIFKAETKRKERPEEDQKRRFRILYLAPKLLQKSHTVQEYEERCLFKNGKKIKYWGFIALINKHKIRVVIRQIGNGEKHFWSIMPWMTRPQKEKRAPAYSF